MKIKLLTIFLYISIVTQISDLPPIQKGVVDENWIDQNSDAWETDDNKTWVEEQQ